MTDPEMPAWPSLPEEETVDFFSRHPHFQPPDIQPYRSWFQRVAERENATLVRVHFIFCTDEYLHTLNLTYLDHDTLTDVITFPFLDPPQVEGDIFISIDRVRDNARALKVPEQLELDRVMIHGLLHLCGYADTRPEEKDLMRKKEDEALALKALSADT